MKHQIEKRGPESDTPSRKKGGRPYKAWRRGGNWRAGYEKGTEGL